MSPRQPLTIRVLDHQPVLTAGIVAVLKTGGYECVRDSRLGSDADPIAAATIVPCDDPSGDIRDARAMVPSHHPIVALLETPSVAHYAAALRAGAWGIAGTDASPRHLLRCVGAAVGGHLVLPVHVTRQLLRP